jgi:ankyrin repeat protein
MDKFMMACENGYLDVAKKMVRDKPEIINNCHFDGIFLLPCKYGHFEVARWLISIKPNINDIPCQQIMITNSNGRLFTPIDLSNEYPFRESCRNGHLEIAKWLLEIDPRINIGSIYGYHEINIFIDSCYRGQLHIAQWLYQFNNNLVYITRAFAMSCKNGHLHIVKWLMDIAPDIDISIDNDYAFRESCKYGYLDVAQWLVEIGPQIDIHNGNEYAFINSCVYKQFSVVKWLQEIVAHDAVRYLYRNNIAYVINSEVSIAGYIETVVYGCKIYSNKEPDIIMLCDYLDTLTTAKSARSY